jgi:hypothetical protein
MTTYAEPAALLIKLHEVLTRRGHVATVVPATGNITTLDDQNVYIDLREQRKGTGWHRRSTGRMYVSLSAGIGHGTRTFPQGKLGFDVEKIADALVGLLGAAKAARDRRVAETAAALLAAQVVEHANHACGVNPYDSHARLERLPVYGGYATVLRLPSHINAQQATAILRAAQAVLRDLDELLKEDEAGRTP